MNQTISSKSAAHLTNLIVTRNGKVPNFSLLLGSGASATSGVRTAQEMVQNWRNQLFDHSNDRGDVQAWLQKQHWYMNEDEYSMLFEEVYDEPSQRRVYIEECIKDAHPRWGYVYLTNLLSESFFDVVFTTNFDDLLNEACYLYSENIRPIVAAHDSAIQAIRVTSGRPKIIKLHGDFLYDNIKNTLTELETLEANTKRKLAQFAKEYGLVVIGYSGRDRSVMDTLDLLLRDDENFKQGVYWCFRRGDQPSDRLKSLLKRDRVYLVEIDGFDEFAAELHRDAKLKLPKPIARPADVAWERARIFVEVDTGVNTHPVIAEHVRRVLIGLNTQTSNLPLAVHAAILSERGEFADSVPVWEQIYEESSDNAYIARWYADALEETGDFERIASFVPGSSLSMINKTYYLLRAQRNEEVVQLASEYLSKSSGDIHSGPFDEPVVRINRAIALKRLDRLEEMEKDLEQVEKSRVADVAIIGAGVAALRRERERMLVNLKVSLHETASSKKLKDFPVFEDFREDEEFLSLLGEDAAG